MTVKLIKRNQQSESNEKPTRMASAAQWTMTTRSWVDEFKARKAQDNLALAELRKLN